MKVAEKVRPSKKTRILKTTEKSEGASDNSKPDKGGENAATVGRDTRMGKKTAAQIRRLQKRAAARGGKYTAPIDTAGPDAGSADSPSGHDGRGNAEHLETLRMDAAAKKLRETLSSLESNTDINAKERRSAKRKAEAIAAEEAGCSASELLQWYEEHQAEENVKSCKLRRHVVDDDNEDDERPSKRTKKNQNPYVLFVGQLSYSTTSDGLFQHFQKELGIDAVTSETLKIRLLTDPKKNNRSRGMAFVETSNPELMYDCLKLHHTHLDGRRINVEKSAGGGSAARQSKIKQFREEQREFMDQTVDKILSDYRSSGDLKEGELDEGVIELCKRHSAATVTAALAKYVEERGGQVQNPSAYLTHIIGKVAVEGVDNDNDKRRKGNTGKRSVAQRENEDDGKKEEGFVPGSVGVVESNFEVMGNKIQKMSEFAKAGVDMSVSKEAKDKKSCLSQIFPSMSRGRGRGRGLS